MMERSSGFPHDGLHGGRVGRVGDRGRLELVAAQAGAWELGKQHGLRIERGIALRAGEVLLVKLDLEPADRGKLSRSVCVLRPTEAWSIM